MADSISAGDVVCLKSDEHPRAMTVARVTSGTCICYWSEPQGVRHEDGIPAVCLERLTRNEQGLYEKTSSVPAS